MSRRGVIDRETRETRIHVEIDLDGAGDGEIVTGIGMFDHLLEQIDARITEDPLQHVHLRVPQAEGKALATLDAQARVYSRDYHDGCVDLDVQAPESVLRRMKPFIVG